MSDKQQGESQVPIKKFSIEDIEASSFIYRFLSRNIGLESSVKRIGLSLSIVIPLIIFIPVTLYEKVFFLGQTIRIVKIGEIIIGMSFLGDTMVWPFIFIVPLCLLITKESVKRSINLLNKISGCISPEWRNAPEDDKYSYKDTVTRVEDIFQNKYRWPGKVLLILPWVIALTFWVYNTDTCSYQLLFKYPYKTGQNNILKTTENKKDYEKVKMQIPDTNHSPAVISRKLEKIKIFFYKKFSLSISDTNEYVSIPKWDCSPKKAPFSWLSTRIWTLFYYGIIPFIIAQLITVIWGITYFLRNTKKWRKKQKEHNNKKTLIIEPFSPDEFGGLGYLADTSMSYLYSISSFALLLVMFFYKEGSDPSWHNYLMIVAFIPFALVVPLIPILIVRDSILNAKLTYLSTISEKINNLSDLMLNETAERKHINQSEKELYYQLSSLKLLYNQAINMPEWPFTYSTFVRIVLSVGTPLTLALLQQYITKLFIS